MDRQLILTCEHAGNEVPREYRHLFEHSPEALETHRGIDIGALELTNTIAKKMEQEAYLHTVTRLLVDLNRSVQSPTLFSEFTRDVSLNVREDIFEKYYRPHREKVEKKIEEIISHGGQAIHVGVHTFTPIWNGREREVDVGFLYDPTREEEQNFCRSWKQELNACSSGLRLKINEPYRGTMDGFTTYLRRNYAGENYIGMEIEVNQRFTDRSLKEEWKELQANISESLQTTLEKFD
jgi:predicted N-formylglutamate amidohydrolase